MKLFQQFALFHSFSRDYFLLVDEIFLLSEFSEDYEELVGLQRFFRSESAAN